MSPTAVLVCSDAGVDAPLDGLPTVVVDDLCHSPAAAARALSTLGATRVVLGLCDRTSASSALRSALRRAGAEPFGIEAVGLAGAEWPLALLAAAAARLGRLSQGDPGRPVLAARPLSRQSLFSPSAVIDYEPVAVLDRSLCLGSDRCALCAEICPANAIAGGGRYPQVDASACTACAECIRRCPAGALHLSGAAPSQVAAQLERLLELADGVVLACARAESPAVPAGWALVTLPSLGVVTSGWILQIRARGREVRLAGCGGPCCARAAATEGLAHRIVGDRQWPVPTPTTSLQLREPAATVEACGWIGAAPAAGDESPLGLLALRSERCTLCGACATSCPTAALQLDEGDDGTTLRYAHAACTGCGRCVAVCPENALDLTRAVDPVLLERGSIELLGAPREECVVCGATLPPAPLRRRLGEMLPGVAGSDLSMCAACARRAGAAAPDHPQREERADNGEDES